MRFQNKIYLFVPLLVAIIFLRCVVYDRCLKQAVNSYQVLADHNRARLQDGSTVHRTRYVLLYTSFFSESYWGLPAETLGPDYFALKHCPVTNCVLTSNHGLLSSVAEYDAVVFHVATPLDVSLPKVRAPKQIYVAAIMESPAHTMGSMQSVGLKVDVYGSCGHLKCPRGNPECDTMLDTTYWFYLSFENSLCVDYVTEKLYMALRHTIVPIVFGGADYERFVPPGSYINAQDYATVNELVDYLFYLMDNPKEYVKYFWWKEHYALDHTNSYCELCQKLHSVGTREKVQYYQDIKAWWYDDACVEKSKIAL
ncbi:LOW QUALITY PROTEIN: alpha-(1,3)-fucosyltransferase C-like [Anopheles ziemanni]|uniref:LOW QUALITY PROTEIN: alpha-(1,3)-fucosyltransferase C-like n=1 Tax=Anopheles coustani TaxID=139045 RepID=UPI0026597551|nr:LOW QUALITY PROTEIN: alpha-(1,3)-fucosyltransferase C-like [Anopheles coustani]XP_058175907.1 LOW QUALITY PROTEIN: alpha-(1,3)-fucosyltransferase C-like [Anopheles ziemanni]